jgi:hypothetical protein
MIETAVLVLVLLQAIAILIGTVLTIGLVLYVVVSTLLDR